MLSNSPCALITGASSGIGYATAAFFLTKGWRVYGLSRSGKVPAGVLPLVVDITDESSLAQAVKELVKETGRLDAVINAAGIGGAGVLETFPVAEARKIMETNFFGTLLVLQATLPLMRENGRGTFVAISSIAGLLGVPFHGLYSASKFAVEGLIESLRLELTGTGVRAVSICPGDTATPIMGNQYRAQTDELPIFYQKNYTKADLAMRDNVDQGIPPEQVAAAIFRTVLQEHPNIRYPVGSWLQIISPLVKRFLPGRLFERMMAGYYGLQ
ncbi:MAG: short-chain dehydrogenase/reductase [Bacteroidetes bacterium]|nr:MAG: short-chain dehydrogenase/reductase [Bacteroidota bacterium]